MMITRHIQQDMCCSSCHHSGKHLVNDFVLQFVYLSLCWCLCESSQSYYGVTVLLYLTWCFKNWECQSNHVERWCVLRCLHSLSLHSFNDNSQIVGMIICVTPLRKRFRSIVRDAWILEFQLFTVSIPNCDANVINYAPFSKNIVG